MKNVIVKGMLPCLSGDVIMTDDYHPAEMWRMRSTAAFMLRTKSVTLWAYDVDPMGLYSLLDLWHDIVFIAKMTGEKLWKVDGQSRLAWLSYADVWTTSSGRVATLFAAVGNYPRISLTNGKPRPVDVTGTQWDCDGSQVPLHTLHPNVLTWEYISNLEVPLSPR